MAKKLVTKYFIVKDRWEGEINDEEVSIMNEKEFNDYKKEYLNSDEVVYEIQLVSKFRVTQKTTKTTKLVEIGLDEKVDEDEEDDW